jgi:DNA replication protein DnaC
MESIQRTVAMALASLPTATPEHLMPVKTCPASTRNCKMKFDDFKTFGEEPLIKAKDKAINFFSDLVVSPWRKGYTLTFLGKAGVGKTALAKTIWDAMRINGWAASDAIKPAVINGTLCRFDCLWKDWRKVSDGFKGGDWSAVEAMEAARLLVLDDIGADYDPNKVAVAKLDRVLRSRSDRWTILTSNLSLQDINKELDLRIASWLIRGKNKFVEITTQDYSRRQL